MRSQEEIDEQIEKLKEGRPNVVTHSTFGTDNLAGLDAQIRVLEKDMDRDDIWDYWDRDEEDMDVRSNAEEALDWLEEESDEDLIDGFPMKDKI